jgi:1,4-dihydroxy-2-naphthoyl-CoA hydrolase
MFTCKTHVRMNDTDAAGVIYFANQFRIAHEAFEHFLDSVNLGVAHMLDNTEYRFPIIHAEADYKAPLKVGDALTIHMSVDRIGDSSVALAFQILDRLGKEVGTVKIVHVAVDKATWKKRPLPRELKNVFEPHRR